MNKEYFYLRCIRTYRSAGLALCGAQLQFAVQVDFTACSRELEHVEGENAGRSLSVSLHLHRIISRVRTSARRQEIHKMKSQSNSQS